MDDHWNDDYLDVFEEWESEQYESAPRFEKLPRKKDGPTSGSDRKRSSRNNYKRARRNAEQARDEA